VPHIPLASFLISLVAGPQISGAPPIDRPRERSHLDRPMLERPSVDREARHAATSAAEHLDRTVAPIALYPDALVAQLLIAATYPLEVVEAARFVRANPKLEGEPLESSLTGKPWDPSVKALCGFPDILQKLAADLERLRDLGDAFLAEPAELMDAVQRQRREARDAGALVETPEQQVLAREDRLVLIEPTTSVVHGCRWRPGFPWGWSRPEWAWGRGTVNVDLRARDRFARKTSRDARRVADPAAAARAPWLHDPAHRHGVPYRDAAVRQRFRESEPSVPRYTVEEARQRLDGSTNATNATNAKTVRPRPPSARPADAFRGARDPVLERAARDRGERSLRGAQLAAAPNPEGVR
jgi:hypothetical protein